jgi:3-oxoacyl-[acyl-carrier protein] reductase
MKEKKYGKIINISSIAGRFRSGFAGAHYTCAKAGVIAFTRQLAYEVAGCNINVNVLCPGQTETGMLKSFLTPKSKKKLEESIPLGYIASPLQQAKVILFLASDDSNYMTGAAIDVNGGQL